MGCNTSKLDDEEAVQICKDRKKFIKQALEHRTKFASGHVAYIQSLKRVSAALREYIEGDAPHEFSLDSFITPPFTPVKKLNPKFITISPKCFSAPAIQYGENSKLRINYYRPSGTESLSVEERPRSPDTYRVQSYSPVHQYGGFDGWFTTRSPQWDSSYYSQSYSTYDRPEIPPPSPQNPSQWDFFWNPFSSLDYYGYPIRSSLEQSMVDDDVAGLRQVREEEGIPDLEEETEHEEIDERRPRREEKPKVDSHVVREEVTVEDVEENDDDDHDHDDLDDEEEEETEEENEDKHKVNRLMEDVNDRIAPLKGPNAGQVEVNRHETMVSKREKKEEKAPGFTVYVNRRPTKHKVNGLMEDVNDRIASLKGPNGGQVKVNRHETMVSKREKKEEAPGFTVYVNRRPTNMDEVIKDLETQFTIVCGAASEVSAMLEANRALHLPAKSEVTGMYIKVLRISSRAG